MEGVRGGGGDGRRWRVEVLCAASVAAHHVRDVGGRGRAAARRRCLDILGLDPAVRPGARDEGQIDTQVVCELLGEGRRRDAAPGGRSGGRRRRGGDGGSGCRDSGRRGGGGGGRAGAGGARAGGSNLVNVLWPQREQRNLARLGRGLVGLHREQRKLRDAAAGEAGAWAWDVLSRGARRAIKAGASRPRPTPGAPGRRRRRSRRRR
jgi:hypothetical protein